MEVQSQQGAAHLHPRVLRALLIRTHTGYLLLPALAMIQLLVLPLILLPPLPSAPHWDLHSHPPLLAPLSVRMDS